MTHSAYMAMADQEAVLVRQSPFMGLLDPQVAGLRTFRRYSRDATVDVTDPWGKNRWLSPKASRIYAILHRESSSGTGRTTMREIASEAMVSTSTVSRTVTKLQAFGFFAIDVIRGRNGGIVIRRRNVGDHLRHYAEAAWKRIRSWINVASMIPEKEKVPTGNYLVVDATFTREAAIERLGARILAGEVPVAEVVGRSRRLTDADREWAKAEEWACQVIIERRRLDEFEPDWDLELEKVRASYGWG